MIWNPWRKNKILQKRLERLALSLVHVGDRAAKLHIALRRIADNQRPSDAAEIARAALADK